LPVQAIEAYEALRAHVLGTGHCRTGLSALLYHGMTRGLAVIMATPEIAERGPENPEGRLPVMANDPALVRLLANMILKFQSELQHVY
jgi:hypothetical protein